MGQKSGSIWAALNARAGVITRPTATASGAAGRVRRPIDIPFCVIHYTSIMVSAVARDIDTYGRR